MEKIRKDSTVFFRKDNTFDWEYTDFPSINAAKKFNGLNSRTVQSAKNLPQKVEKAAEQ